MTLSALPAFADNYIWMLHDGHQALVVDPGEAAPVQAELARLGLTLAAILVTHRHADHVGGIPLLQTGRIPVYGPASLLPHGVTQPVEDGQTISLLGTTWRVWHTPGHTSEHLAFVQDHQTGPVNEAPLAFVGDTLFSGGCGRAFDGPMAALYQSLCHLNTLPSGTRLCPAHEYTLSNLRFALAVEPDNQAIREHVSRCEALREQSLPTLPTTLGQERLINPFLRCDEAAVVQAAQAQDVHATAGLSTFAALRLWKNSF